MKNVKAKAFIISPSSSAINLGLRKVTPKTNVTTVIFIWIIYFPVFNSNGKRPNGMMSYFFDECTARSHFDSTPCPYDDLNYPLGHQLSMGSFAVSIVIVLFEYTMSIH